MENLTFKYNDGGRSIYFKGKNVGDCVVRAVAIATGIDYKEVYDTVSKIAGKTPRNGVAKEVTNKLLQEYGWTWVPTMLVGQGCKVHLRKDELPQGTIICRTSKHLTTVIDGVINDTFDCSRGGTRCVYGYWIKKIKKKKMNNIAEILKDAPKGLELYSTVYGHVKFTDLKDTNIQEKAIAVVDEDGVNRYFSENGYLSRHGEMLLFPSYHEYINGYGWENWGNSLLPRSIGSVVVDEDFEGLFLITSKNTLCDSAGMEFETLWKRLRYATKEESERFFGNLEYHGYRYDNELKKVFNIKCEFQIGDTIRRKDNKETFKIVGKDITVYTPPVSPTFKLSNGDWISFQALKENYVLVENTADNSKDTQNQCERFTINDFHPFDKVLVRINQDEWHIEFFECINRDGDTGIDYYTCLYDTYRQCVPYNEETQHLLGTTEEYDGKYKTW